MILLRTSYIAISVIIANAYNKLYAFSALNANFRDVSFQNKLNLLQKKNNLPPSGIS